MDLKFKLVKDDNVVGFMEICKQKTMSVIYYSVDGVLWNETPILFDEAKIYTGINLKGEDLYDGDILILDEHNKPEISRFKIVYNNPDGRFLISETNGTYKSMVTNETLQCFKIAQKECICDKCGSSYIPKKEK